MFKKNVYVQVFANRIVAKNLENGQVSDVQAVRPFSHPRTLLDDCNEAGATMRAAILALKGKDFFLIQGLVIQAMEKNEGGLTAIEKNILRELALTFGAAKVVVWEGEALTDAAVLEKINAA